MRPAATTDDATPNANAVAAENLVRLAVLAGDEQWRAAADALFDGVLPLAAANLFGHAALLNALDLRLRMAEIVIAGQGARADDLHGGRAEAAVPRSRRAARRQRRRAAGVTSGAGEGEGGERSGGVRVRRRDLLAAGDGAGEPRGFHRHRNSH